VALYVVNGYIIKEEHMERMTTCIQDETEKIDTSEAYEFYQIMDIEDNLPLSRFLFSLHIVLFRTPTSYFGNSDSHSFRVSVAGNSAGIRIHAVFVSKASGEILKKYAGWTNVEIWLIPTFENSAWSIMAISFISLLAMSAVLATCFFVRRHRIRRERPRGSLREFHGMSSRLVKAMPSLIFTAVLEDNCTSRTCAICLEDYCIGEKIRILPCCHSKRSHDIVLNPVYYSVG